MRLLLSREGDSVGDPGRDPPVTPPEMEWHEIGRGQTPAYGTHTGQKAKKWGPRFGPRDLKGMETLVLTVEQLAERFQLSPKTVYRALERRELRAAKLGNRWRIRLEDAELWFDEHVPDREMRTTPGRSQLDRVPPRDGSLRALLETEREGAV
jgi:excisionase family DNA binding protein